MRLSPQIVSFLSNWTLWAVEWGFFAGFSVEI